MKRVLSAMLSLFVIIPAFGLDKEKAFKVNRAETYVSKQAQGKVIVAAVPYNRPEDIRTAFGKAELDKYGVVPVLVIIDNNGTQAIRVEMIAEYVTAGGKHLEATPAEEIMYLNGVKPPKALDQPRYPIPTRKAKNKLEAWEVTGRAFTAKMVPPGESVSGFVYFQTHFESGSRLYVRGLSEAGPGGKDLIYFEIPLPSE